jgi:hypothetical protein
MAKTEASAKQPLWAQGEIVDDPKAEPEKKPLWANDPIIETPKAKDSKQPLWAQGELVKPEGQYNPLTALGDVGVGLAQGVTHLPEIPIGMRKIGEAAFNTNPAQFTAQNPLLVMGEAAFRKAYKAVTGSNASELEKKAMEDIKAAREGLQGFKSEAGKYSEAKAAEAVDPNAPWYKRAGQTMYGLAANPRALTNVVAESVPQMIAGARIAKPLESVLGTAGALGFGEGLQSGTSTAASVASQTKDGQLDPTQAGLSVVSGTLTGLFGVAGNKAANYFNASDINEIFMRGAATELPKTVKSKVVNAIKSGLIEAGIEEAPQSGQEQIAQNLALGKPWYEGVAESMAQGFMAALPMGAGAGFYNQYKTNKAIKDAHEEIDVEEDEGQRIASRNTLMSEDFSNLESKAAAIKAKTEQAVAAEAPAVVAEEAPIVAEEATTPTTKLDKATINSLGIRTNTNAYKALDGLDITTPEGRSVFDQTIEANQSKIKEDKVNELLASLPEITTEVPDVDTQPLTTEPTTDRDSVQALDERGADVAEGAPQDKTGALGTAGDNVGQPVGGTESVATPLEEFIEVGGAKFRKTANGYERVEEPVAEQPIEEAPVEPEAPQATEVMMSEEDLQAETDLAQLTKSARNLSSELRNLDPTSPIIEDLLAFDVNEDTLAEAKAEIATLMQQRQAKGQTTQGELRELSEDQKAAAADQDVENFVDKVYGPKEATTDDARPVPELERVAPGITKLADETESHKTFGETLTHMQDNYAEHLTNDQQILIEKLKTINSVNTAGYELKDPVLLRGVEGVYKGLNNKIEMRRDAVDPIVTLLHEGVHAATVHSVGKHLRIEDGGGEPFGETYAGKTESGKLLVEVFDKAKEAAKNNTGLGVVTEKHNAFRNIREFIAEVYTNEKFQKFLAEQPSVAKGKYASLWTDFVQAVKGMLGLEGVSDSMLSDAIAGSHEMFTEKPERGFGMNRTFAQPSPAKKQKIKQLQQQSGIKKPSNNTGKSLFKSVTDFDVKHAMDNFSSAVLSSDNALNNQMRRALEQSGMSWNNIKKILEGLMTSQSTHSQNVANMFLEQGKIDYDPAANMFQVTDNPNGSWGKMMETINEMAKAEGMSMDEMELAAHTYFVANRARGFVAKNKALKKKVLAMLVAGDKKGAKKLWDSKYVLVHMTPAEIKAGMEIRKELPDIGKVFEQWHGIRQEVITHLTNTGLYSQEQAADLWDTFDYVPFYREAQIEANQGPKEYTRGLLDRARQKHVKGSYNPVNNVFDNMNRWITYSIARGINNNQARYTVDAMQQYMVGSISPKPLPPTTKVNPGNLVAVWDKGIEKRYRAEDPLIVHYFTGARAAFAPMINNFAVSGTNKFFRASIVLDPIFSLGQLIMDGTTAMFTSSVQFPLKIPVLAVKEFLLTIPNWSKTHKMLRGYGAVGETDYTAVSSRMAEEAKYGAREMNVVEKIANYLLKPLKWITMASDNAIRQAVYEQRLKETGDKAEAIRAAFEIINFRRAGYSAMVNTIRQSVPFTGAYLQYINVTSKVLTGKGITPMQKKQTYMRMMNAMGQYGLLMFLITMAVGDDDEYKDADNTQRDLHMYIPGLTEKTGIWLPLRADPFTLVAKMIPEHIVNLSKKEGGEDWTKFKKAFKDFLGSALLGPTPMPQLPKTALQASINYDFNTGRPIVGQGVEGRATGREYSMYTSEIAKRIGSTGVVSPMMVDYWLNNIGGSLSRSFVTLSNSYLKDKDAPEKSTRDKLASFAPKFIKREFGARGKNDLYELRDIVDEAYLTYKDIEKFGSKEQYDKAYEMYIDKVAQKPGIDQAIKQLGQLRTEERMILESPPGDMNKEQKEKMIRNIREEERVILFDIQFKRDLSGLDKGNPFRKEK